MVKTLSKAAAGSLVLANDLRHGGRAVIKLLDRGPGVTKNLEREILTHRRRGARGCSTLGLYKQHLATQQMLSYRRPNARHTDWSIRVIRTQ